MPPHTCHPGDMSWNLRHTHPRIQNPKLLLPRVELPLRSQPILFVLVDSLGTYIEDDDPEDVGTQAV